MSRTNSFYDILDIRDAEPSVLRVASLVGLIPLLAVETLEPDLLERAAAFPRMVGWFMEDRADAGQSHVALVRAGCWRAPHRGLRAGRMDD
jgi:hypothetical protein